MIKYIVNNEEENITKVKIALYDCDDNGDLCVMGELCGLANSEHKEDYYLLKFTAEGKIQRATNVPKIFGFQLDETGSIVIDSKTF